MAWEYIYHYKERPPEKVTNREMKHKLSQYGPYDERPPVKCKIPRIALAA